MTKKRYFTISKKERYGAGLPLFRFEKLDGAMGMFKYLMEGEAINIESRSVPDNKQTPDKDGWVSSEYLNVYVGSQDYQLGSENVDVYTEEEYAKIKSSRDEWLQSFKTKEKLNVKK
jgi:hypothetical protein